MIRKLINFVVFLVPLSESADILAILPTPSFSHQIAYRQLWKDLSLRGHKVTLITTDPINDSSLTNLTEIDVNFSYKYKEINKIAEAVVTMWNIYDWILPITLSVSESQLTYPPIQDLIHNRTKFDVVFVEFLYPEFLAFAEIYKCPKIVFSTMDANMYFHRIMENSAHPFLNPDLPVYFSIARNFKERLIGWYYSWYVSYVYGFKVIPAKQTLMQKYFNITLSLDELIKDIDMLFVNVNPVIQDSRAIGPNTINVGSRRMTKESQKASPKDLQRFLDEAKDGFIYFSLGTNVKSKDLNKQSLQSIIESLREMPYKVLWKFEADDLPGKPDNVQLIKWAPQQDILAHPNIKLFVMQGGLQSMEEAIYSAVPLVVIPFYADQEKNANLMVAKGIARRVERKPFIRKEDLKNAMMDAVNNPSYKNSVKRLKQLALDTPMTGLEQAIWWTEYVIRNKGAKHLRNPAADLPFYQYYLIDVISFLIISTIIVLSLIILLAKLLVKTIFCVFKDRNSLTGKKTQ